MGERADADCELKHLMEVTSPGLQIGIAKSREPRVVLWELVQLL
jgi:hypothetical protein